MAAVAQATPLSNPDTHALTPAPTVAQGAPRGALRFLTAGSVDDGKSTLIGRLLYDSRAILADQLDALHTQARHTAAAGDAVATGDAAAAANRGIPDLSLLTDGLEAEREQGITIDVAYRYFATRQRKFIIADAPGHEQYTRNMVTAAAGSDAAVVLVDITKLELAASPIKLLPQTRRHALLAQLLRVPSIVFAVNKLDAVADPATAFAAVRAALEAFAHAAGIVHAGIVPVSALRGDNVAQPLAAAWYRGPSLLQLLEQLPTADELEASATALATATAAATAALVGAATTTASPAAFGLQVPAAKALPLMLPVQYVARAASAGAPNAPSGIGERPRTYWGRIAQGGASVGDAVQAFPSGQQARIVALRHAGRSVRSVPAGQSAGIVLDRQLDISRGDWIGAPATLTPVEHFEATLAWLDTEAAQPGRRYWVRHAHRWVQARIERIEHRLDIQTLLPETASELGMNQIGRVVVRLQQPLPLAPYARSRVGGALIVVDPTSHRTSGALLVATTAFKVK